MTVPRDALVEVAFNRDLGAGYFLLGLLDAHVAATFRAGQFAMVEVAGGPRRVPEPLLRRPFSVQRRFDGPGGPGCEVLYKVVGVGTARMAVLRPGDRIRVLGPLGRPFGPVEPGEAAVLVGGGVGIPPLVALADELDAAGHDYHAILGVRGAADGPCFSGFRGPRRGRVEFCADDGSVGRRGTVLDALVARWDAEGGPAAGTRVYACGPKRMLDAVAAACESRGVVCQISVETLMGCGMGACMACVIRARAADAGAGVSPYDRWLLTCLKGPVFDSREVVVAGEAHR